MSDSKVTFIVELSFIHDGIDEVSAKKILLNKINFSEYLIQDNLRGRNFNVLIKSKKNTICK